MENEIRENVLRFYATMTNRDYKDTLKEYNGITEKGEPIDNKLYMATERVVAAIRYDLKEKI